MNTTRRGFFAFIAGAAALAVMPLAATRKAVSTTSGAWLRPGDILIVTNSSGVVTHHRVTSIDGSTATVDRMAGDEIPVARVRLRSDE